MGFFANRWIEKHGADTEKAALSTGSTPVVQPKTKWYSRKKDQDSGGPSTSTANGKSQSQKPANQDTVTANGTKSRPAPSYGTWSAKTAPTVMSDDEDTQSRYGTMRKLSSASQPGPSSLPARLATDNVTVTLAQRLDELATANADGLLSDDEYRLLRQNLFERFGSVAAQIPAEQSPIALPSPLNRKASMSNSNAERTSGQSSVPQGDSNFNVSKGTHSIRSNRSQGSSIQTAITSLIRRATRRSSTTPRTSFGGSGNDAESTYSRGSRNSSVHPRGLPRTLVHKASAGSIQTSPSLGAMPTGSGSGTSYDVRSIASRRTNRSGLDSATFVSRTTSRSRPPSSYHRRHAPSEGGGSDEIGADWTAAELRAEIVSLEEENKKVLDMFNGLEMTVLMKYRPAMGGRIDTNRANIVGSPTRELPTEWKLSQDMKKLNAHEKSSRASVSSSSLRSFAALQRKGSLSFLSRRNQALPPLPPLPTAAVASSSSSASNSNLSSSALLPSTSSSLHPMTASQSNRSSPNLSLDRVPSSPTPHGKLSRSRSGFVGTNHGREDSQPLNVVNLGVDDERDTEQVALERGLEDIRRKRASVVSRYDKRLEYLRARLRTAEIHERLLK
ncbi:hypothetical protein PIIN_07842 [Serendipita indica DSM 11827]|uniref:Uncharacterized protein n=1 Tax=Serendipita indica (strain DSM 11827) TaxID=1109443 RepID=G4TRE6_SERID|nr:hypothetical protein PIIN_07842 [Serendipita indica DSM 11827]